MATPRIRMPSPEEVELQKAIDRDKRIEGYVKWIEDDYAKKKAKVAHMRGAEAGVGGGKLNYLEPPRADTKAGELQEEVNEAFRRFRERNRL